MDHLYVVHVDLQCSGFEPWPRLPILPFTTFTRLPGAKDVSPLRAS
ncbi:hypothetical protein FOXYSP1_19617 [Fusarium oxysporum f. sp. phaseoli]